MSLWLNWKERLTSNQKVAGSSPAKDFKKYLTYIMKKLRGGNIVVSIIGGIINFVINVVLTICVMLFMTMSVAVIALVVGGYIFLQKLLELINIVTGGLTMVVNPAIKGIVKFVEGIVKIFKPPKKKNKKAKPKSYKIPKIPTKPEEIIYAVLGIPPQETVKQDEEEEDDENCPAD